MAAYDHMEELGLRNERMVITSCDGILTTNDYNRDLCARLITNGANFYDIISRYDMLAANVAGRDMELIGNRARMAAVFLKAHGITDHMAYRFAVDNLNLMDNARETMDYVTSLMPTFVMSSAFEHHSMAVRDQLLSEPADMRSSEVEFDSIGMDRAEARQLVSIADRISRLSLPKELDIADDIAKEDVEILMELDEVFMEQLPELTSFGEYTALTTFGVGQKSFRMLEYRKERQIDVGSTVYIGHDYEDKPSMELIRDSDGLSIAFNGDPNVIRSCNIAVIGDTATPLAALAAEFYDYGIEAVFDMADNWNAEYLDKRICSDRNLTNAFLEQCRKKLPAVIHVTKDNVDDVIARSLAYRRKMEERFRIRY